jgi:hypothetical protein
MKETNQETEYSKEIYKRKIESRKIVQKIRKAEFYFIAKKN